MEEAVALCTQLGYPDDIDSASDSFAKILVNDIKMFANHYADAQNLEAMATAYLEYPNAIFYPQGAPLGVDVPEVLSHLFSIVVQHQVDTIPNPSYETEHGFLSAPDVSNFGALRSDVGINAPKDEYSSAQRAASEIETIGPITRLAMKESKIVSNLMQAGFSDLPIASTSQEELLGLLRDWLAAHWGEDPPASKHVSPYYVLKEHSYAMDILFATTSDVVSTKRFWINASFIGWMLKDADGSCMLVKPATGNGGNHRGYHAWLGGDLGFTTKVIAGTPKYMAIDLIQDTGKDDTISAILEKLSPKERLGLKREGLQGGINTAITVKTEPSRSENRSRDFRRNHVQRQTGIQRWRLDSPLSADRGPDPKTYWPPQYVSPPATPSPKRKRPHNSKRSIARISPSQNVRLRSPSLEIVSRNSTNAARGNAPPAPDVSRITYLGMNPGPRITQDVMFHFFLSDENLGAMPVTLDQCTSATQFFKQAEVAWNFLNEDRNPRIKGVSVNITGLEWPLVVSWKSSDGYKRLMKTLEGARAAGTGDMIVKVNCIVH